MTQEEVLKNARTCLGPYCKGCPVCNGRACKNTMPGPGAKAEGDTAIRNNEKWREIRVQMDTLCENCPVDTSLEIFGKKFAYPFFAGPVGAVTLHFGDKYDDAAYRSHWKSKRPGCSDGKAVERGNGSRKDGVSQKVRCFCGSNGH